MKKIIFNSSMPRSGSELLQVILNQNPNIYGSATSPLFDYINNIRLCQENAEVKSQPKNMMYKSFLSTSLHAMVGYYKPITNKPVVCDKSRSWMWQYDLLSKIMKRKPIMLCMVRDLRDIFVSMEMNWRKNRHLPIGPDNAIELTNMTIEERVAFWSQNHPVGFSTKRLLDAGEQNLLEDVFFIRYENFTRHPDEIMKEVYEYIKEPYYQHDFNNIVKTVEEDHSWHGPYGNHDVNLQLKPSESKYKEILGDAISNKIVKGHKWYFKRFYPEVFAQGEF